VGLRVKDRSVISRFKPESEIGSIHIEDDIELFFDPDHNHNHILSGHDMYYLFAAAGMVKRVVNDSGHYTYSLTSPVVSKVHVQGTLNREDDTDTGYVLEVAFPLDDLGIRPGPGLTMGFEIKNGDRDYEKGEYFHSSWTGNPGSNLGNPSEWGNLRFMRKRSSSLFWIMVIILVALTGALLVLARRGARTFRQSSLKRPIKQEILNAQTYISENYHDPDLNREKVASHVNLSPSHFSSLFKKECGLSFIDYLNNYRIEQAEKLLKETDRNISQITYDVGFSSLGYFGKIFKKVKKISPKDLRKAIQSVQSNNITNN
jgi:AraC-like DNA-binding protein